MANQTVTLNNYSDDSQIKRFMAEELAPRVFHDIPLSVLNTGFFSLVSEYISQITEQLGFTSAFYFNEAFITKAVLPDSIYAEAAIFNIGYSFATPASTNFLFELKIEDIYKNAKYNPNNGLYEFILDKDTKINLPEGFVYSFDYDILIQYKNVETSEWKAMNPVWNVQYINRDESNVCATNKHTYITYRVTDIWLCLLIQANEYEREKHTIVNNMTNGVPNQDTVITCKDHIAGFDIKYIDVKGNEKWLTRDHILAIHDSVKDNEPYVHYIMDNPQTIRFMWQLSGNRYFVPEPNSSYEIIIYTCHGKAANAPDYKNDKQPNVLTTSNRYSNNGNVLKAAFVVSGCYSGADIGTVETVRRETIEAYNTANVISSDHDIEEWFKTFYFKNILYPYFFKRRDDPWGRIWSGFIALTDNDNYVYRTNTLHARIPYDVLYNNSQNTISNNEIIIPPGWVWTYTTDENRRFTVTPYTKGNGTTVETVKTLANISDKFVFSNPFGIRIQKKPFAIGYFNPWVDQFVIATRENIVQTNGTGNPTKDGSLIYHANHLMTYVSRTYSSDCYTFITHIYPTMVALDGDKKLVEYFRNNATTPSFVDSMWNYFKEPLDPYGGTIPMLPLKESDGYIPFDPEKTFLCVRNRKKDEETNIWHLSDIWIEDETTPEHKTLDLSITGQNMYIYGSDDIWGDDGKAVTDYAVYVSDTSNIEIYNTTDNAYLNENDPITFTRIPNQNYYEMRMNENFFEGAIIKIQVKEAYETDLTKYGETKLYRVGRLYQPTVYINIEYNSIDSIGNIIHNQKVYSIKNAANLLIPFKWNEETSSLDNYIFDMSNIGPSGIILYADMKPSPEVGNVDYYKFPFSELPSNDALFYIHSEQFPMYKNNMRVVMHVFANGSETGRVEMQPISLESDGSYKFATTMYPLTELIDIDNRINIASVNNGGGDWKPVNGDTVYLDALDPQIKISMLIKSDDKNKDSDIEIGDEFTGYRLMDRYKLDDVNLVQELKEMRSVVTFGDSSIPTQEQILLYKAMIGLSLDNPEDPYNIYYMTRFAYDKKNGFTSTFVGIDDRDPNTFTFFKSVTIEMRNALDKYFASYYSIMYTSVTPEWFGVIRDIFNDIIEDTSETGDDLDWNEIYGILFEYPNNVNDLFKGVEVNGGVTIQLVPFVEYTLMTSDRFRRFISSFTQIHKAIEPVIFKRLEGNNYLDCKLLATYGLPHSYSSDVDYEYEGVFWPDLNVQIEFDVKLYNYSLTTNTIDELRNIIKSYFNRITTVHTPLDAINMDNNIYISHVIQQMEEHDNVAYMKFKGWYTNEKGKVNGNYMNAEYQAIVQKWKKLEDMPTDELERFVPEMFVLDDDNIVINIIK